MNGCIAFADHDGERVICALDDGHPTPHRAYVTSSRIEARFRAVTAIRLEWLTHHDLGDLTFVKPKSEMEAEVLKQLMEAP